MEVSCQLLGPPALPSVERALGTHGTGVWVGPGFGWDILENRKIS